MSVESAAVNFVNPTAVEVHLDLLLWCLYLCVRQRILVCSRRLAVCVGLGHIGAGCVLEPLLLLHRTYPTERPSLTYPCSPFNTSCREFHCHTKKSISAPPQH